MRPLLVLVSLALASPAAFANARPEAQPDRYVFRQGESVDVRPPGVLGNDTDADGDSLFLEPAEPASAGQLILFPDGSFSYTPDERFDGTDRFTYRACDDGGCSAPVEVRLAADGIAAPLASRPDRFELVAGSAVVDFDVLANDRFEPGRIVAGRLDVVSAASQGDLEVLPRSQGGFHLRYRPHAGAVGEDRFRYRLCEAAARCVEADVEVVILPVAPVRLDVSAGAGFADLPLRGLPELPEPRLTFTGTGKASTYAFPISVDATPLEPWAGGGSAQTLFTAEGGESGRDLRLRVDLAADDADVDLYVGTDDDGNRRATSDEVACVSARSAGTERCVLELSVPAEERRHWWVYAHNREGRRVSARLQVLEIDVADASPLAWTAPGRVEAGADAAFRVSWVDQALLPGELQEAWMKVESEPGTTLGWVPLSLVGAASGVAPRLLRDGETVRFGLPEGAIADALVLDVPEGTASFTVSAVADGTMSLALHRAPAPDGTEDGVVVRPPGAAAEPAARARSVEGVATLEIRDTPAGRWFVRVEQAAMDLGDVAINVDLATEEGFEPRLRPGVYAPPSRPGEGLIVDRAGSNWSGIWYAFDDAGASTWLYLQGEAPADGAAWAPTIYRSAMGNGGRRLAVVGRGSLAVLDGGAPVWSFEVDGRVGSQRLFDFGRGCPVDRGAPRDLSGLWYDPAYAGEGYGLWITADYEFYGLFTHDARGEPRYLSAEGGGFRVLGSRRLPLVAYRNACLFCPRGERRGETVGDLDRAFAPSLSPILTRVDAVLGTGLRGGVARNETLERLGGETAGLGCPSS
ncbi:hypothetical protein GCM10028794_25370 [Silanimonas algicola]